MSKQTEALKLALHVMRNQGDIGVDEWIAASQAILGALAEQHRKAVQDAIVGGTGIMKGGERIDPASIYAEQPAQQNGPWCMKMNGCKTKCEDCPDEVAEQPAQQEPDYWLGFGLQAHTEKPFDGATPVWTSPQPPAQPLTDEQIIASNYPDGEENGPTIAAPDFELICFARQIEAAHNIKEKQ